MDLKFSIPRGSCSGANILTCYSSLINESVPLSVTLTGFPDGLSTKKSFPAKCHKSEENTINTIESTLITVINWMTSMHLKPNNYKMEYIMFGSRQMLKHANTSHLDFDSSLVQQSKLVKHLGGQLNSSLTFEEHVKQ